MVAFPTKVWLWNVPGRRGATIGSSEARWLNPHALTKLTPLSCPNAARSSGPGGGNGDCGSEGEQGGGDPDDDEPHHVLLVDCAGL